MVYELVPPWQKNNWTITPIVHVTSLVRYISFAKTEKHFGQIGNCDCINIACIYVRFTTYVQRIMSAYLL